MPALDRDQPAPDPLALLANQPGVPAAMAAARDAVDTLLRDRGLRRTGPDDTVESLLRGAAASAALAGGRSPVDLRVGDGDPIATAAIRVSTELMGLQPVWRRSPVQALARLHALATSTADESRGRPKSAAGAVAMQRLGDVVLSGTSAPAMVLAAVVHAEVATAGGFGAAAGLVARAAERLVLVDTGVDPTAVTVPEAGHARSPQAYELALAGYRERGRPGVVAWLLHAADAYAYGVQRSPLS